VNILIVSYYQFYPPITGAGIAQFGTIKYLSNVCNISLLISEKFCLSQENLDELKTLLPKVKIYNLDRPINKNIIKKNRIVNIFGNLTYFCRNLLKRLKKSLKDRFYRKKHNANTFSLEHEFEFFFSPNQFYTHNKRIIDTINKVIIDDEIDIVQLEFFENLNLVEAIPSSIKKIFVSHELRFARIKSHIEAKKIFSPFSNYILMLNKTIELSFLKKFDAVISFSEYDSLELQNALAEKGLKIRFATIPVPVIDQDFQEIAKDPNATISKLIFIGGEGHFPNKDAVEWFLETTATEIFSKLGLRLYVIGHWSKETILKYQNHPSNVSFTGFVEKISDVLKNSISIAPVRIGGGIQTKVLVSMAQGIPVVCTKFASTGINVKHLESIMLAEDKDSFFKAIQYYINNPQHTLSMCRQAQDILKNEYSQEVISQLRYKFYQDCLMEMPD
jgi:glycosyltransferase involved in cell wall biosynthesis